MNQIIFSRGKSYFWLFLASHILIIEQLTQKTKDSAHQKLESLKHEIKNKAHSRGYYTKDEFDKLRSVLRPADFCSHKEKQLLLEKQIGQGGFGTVYKGTYKNSKGQKSSVAIKKVNYDELNDKSKSAVIQELYFLQKFAGHKHLLGQIKCFYQSRKEARALKDAVFIVMPMMSLGSLAGQLRRIPAEGGALLKIMIACATAVRELHRQSIIHRDIKLENFLSDGNDIKLADFGISKELSKADGKLSGLAGTYSYMAPEVVQGKPYGLSADIFSLGVMFLALLSKKTPASFVSNERKSPTINFGVYNKKTGLLGLVKLMTDKEQENRPSIEKVLESLQKLLEQTNQPKPKASKPQQKKIGKPAFKKAGQKKKEII